MKGKKILSVVSFCDCFHCLQQVSSNPLPPSPTDSFHYLHTDAERVISCISFLFRQLMTSTRLKVLKIKCRKFDWNVFRVYKLTGASRVGTKSELQGSVQIETWIKTYFSSFLLYLQQIKLSHLVLFEIFFPPPQVPNSFPCSCIPFLSSHAKLYKEVCGHLRNLCLPAQVLICLPVPT